VQKLGWAVVCVLKQERFEVYQEASALRAQQPTEAWESAGRQIRAQEVRDLRFTEAALGPVRVVLADECWEEVQRVAGQKRRVRRESH
jgi:hypothetical protein